MKAKLFQKYQNYAFYVFINDLDEEFSSDGSVIIKEKNCTTYKAPTKQELKKLWDKEVIKIEPADSGMRWPEGGGPTAIRLYVSRFTEEERKERAHQKEIEEAKKNLERLTDRHITIGAKIKHPEIKKSKVNAKYLTITGDKTFNPAKCIKPVYINDVEPDGTIIMNNNTLKMSPDGKITKIKKTSNKKRK